MRMVGVFVGLVMALAPSMSMAFDFSGAAVRELPVLGEGASPIRFWQQAKVEEGDTLWEYCTAFNAAIPMPDVDQLMCARHIARLNGIANPNQISEGATIWLPSLENDPAETLERRAQRQAAVEAAAADEAALKALAENPLGMASELRKLMVGNDEIVASLRALEQSQLTPDAVNSMIESAVSAGGFATQTEVATIRSQLSGLANRPNLTAADVTAAISAALSGLNIPDEQAIKAIVAAETAALVVRVDAVERNLGVIDTAVAGHTTAIAGLEAADVAAAQAAADETARVDAAIAAETAAREAADAGQKARADVADTRMTALMTAVILAAVLAVLAIVGVVYQHWTKASKKALAVVESKADQALAHTELALEMLFDGAELIGGRPTQEMLDGISLGGTMTVAVKRNGAEHRVVFTKTDKGFEVKGITGHRGIIAPRVANVLRVLAKAARKDGTDFTPETEVTVLGAPLTPAA